ncbi:MAG: cytochrome b [Gammaproteobacteria bacterium]|nr:cytochrome b [Gammaproteobacteria bacterium]MBU2057792.1 cytochrome b [Gammaproteobacteria bacterium]MBU2176773.1 cytochrome b [Gammaproteobacteria bacterium]MBU2247906.1 cytochrome b [Gammaproteobacteria bacterium]MBU2345283.1 cytochrome b [Gammaproteobacteria bacterium]
MATENKGYSWTGIILHWLVAVMVIGLFASGFWMVDLSYYSSWYRTAPFWHKSVGVLLLALMLYRLVFRLVKGAAAPLSIHSKAIQRASHLTHLTLYSLVFLIICSGYLISTADGRPIEVFGWFDLPSAGELFAEQADKAGLVHKFAAYGLIALVFLHAMAAFKHHFFDKDDTLKRMLKP